MTWIILPTYNEIENIGPMLEALMALPVPDLHVLVVDDLSPDGTGERADALAATRYAGRLHVLHRRGPRGLGHAYKAGFTYALAQGAQRLVQMDCDFSHQPQDVPRLLDALDEADMVIGSRYVRGGGTAQEWGPARKVLSSWGNFYARVLLGLPFRDVTGGFRAWRRATLIGIAPAERIQAQGYVFQVELIYLAYKLGYRIREIPIYFPERRAGRSKMNLKIQLEAAWRVWQVGWRHRHLTPADRVHEEMERAPR